MPKGCPKSHLCILLRQALTNRTVGRRPDNRHFICRCASRLTATRNSKMRVHRSMLLSACLLLAGVTNTAHAGHWTPTRARLRTLSLRAQATGAKNVHIDIGDIRVPDALDLNMPIPNGPSVVKTLASALKEHPDAPSFSMQWGLYGPTSQQEYGVRYDRRRHHLSFLSWGFGNSGGPSLRDHFWYTRVSDKQILKLAARKKLSVPAGDHFTKIGLDDWLVEDKEFLPWFNELKRQGCPRHKLKFSVKAMSRARLSDNAH